ncbi:MAG: CvpA family protein [Candidatus Solibacter usitatus]|nr:CvpA family protein [Candidatus Solibacter usitatus]
MNWLDILLCVLLGLFVFQGVRQGFTRLAIGLAATVAGLLLAAWFYGAAGAFLIPYVSSKAIANIFGFLAVFIGTQIAGTLLGLLLAKLFKWSGLSWLDRLMGAVFGFIKTALVGMVLVMVILAFPVKPVPAAVAQSRIAPYLIEASHILAHLAPREFRDGFVSTYDRIKKLWSGREAGEPPKDSA